MILLTTSQAAKMIADSGVPIGARAVAAMIRRGELQGKRIRVPLEAGKGYSVRWFVSDQEIDNWLRTPTAAS